MSFDPTSDDFLDAFKLLFDEIDKDAPPSAPANSENDKISKKDIDRARKKEDNKFSNIDEFENHIRLSYPDVFEEVLLRERELLLSELDNIALEPNVTNELSTESRLERVAKIEKSKLSDADKAENQEPKVGISTTVTAPSSKNDVLLRMQNDHYAGPLKALCSAVTDRKRVKIWIRNRANVRSILTCYVAAFDKHWNVALEDVDELYFKPIHVRVLRRKTKKEGEDESLLDEENISPSLIYTSVDKNFARVELMRRHVPQLFVRGDYIIMISLGKK